MISKVNTLLLKPIKTAVYNIDKIDAIKNAPDMKILMFWQVNELVRNIVICSNSINFLKSAKLICVWLHAINFTPIYGKTCIVFVQKCQNKTRTNDINIRISRHFRFKKLCFASMTTFVQSIIVYNHNEKYQRIQACACNFPSCFTCTNIYTSLIVLEEML